ncbi:MAG: redox-sensing transcriptional repressor Rex [Clostridia bacterium]|nr:redox-sensing transcriptional repressor Rex [Clostridia bacterium]
MPEKKISTAVIRRMPKYYKYVNQLLDSGITRISSSKLAEMMGLTASQVRQDFNCFGGFGQQGYGYNVEFLRDEIANILNINKKNKAIIIGVGNLGRTLINNFNFSACGVQIVCGFDVNVEGHGNTINNVPIYNVSELETVMQNEVPDLAVLTLPKRLAKTMTARLIECGIKAIWNFTNVDLHLDFDCIPIEDVHFSESLMTLTYRLKEKQNKK